MFSFWRNRKKACKAPPPSPRHNPLRARLGVEQIEDRLCPANLTLEVTTLADVVNPNDDAQGVFSLRERLAQANAATPTTQHYICFKTTLWGGVSTLDPALGELTLTKNIFLDGPVNKITIQRDSTSAVKHRLFHVEPTSVSQIARLTLLNGYVDGSNTWSTGGGVLSRGSLTLESCEIRSNTAFQQTGGGVSAHSGILTGSNCQINGNSASIGGGIYIGERVVANITNTVVGLNVTDSSGGGIYIFSSDNATATSVSLSGVQVIGNIAGSKGGGIAVSKLLGTGAGTNLTLSGGTHIYNNTVTSQTIGKGGGLYFGSGTLTFIASGTAGPVKIESNSAKEGDGMYRVEGTVLVGTSNPPNPDYLLIDDQDFVGPG